jgi:hypothetical protein
VLRYCKICLSQQSACPHIPENTEFVTNNNMVIIPHSPHSTRLHFLSPIENETEGTKTASDIQRESHAIVDSIKTTSTMLFKVRKNVFFFFDLALELSNTPHI